MATRANIIITDNADFNKIFYQHFDGYIYGGLGEVLLCELEDYCSSHKFCNPDEIAKLLSLKPAQKLNSDIEFLYIINVNKFSVNVKEYDLRDDLFGASTLNADNYKDVLSLYPEMLIEDETFMIQPGNISNENINISEENLSEYCFNFTELNSTIIENTKKQISMLKGITSKLNIIISLLNSKQ